MSNWGYSSYNWSYNPTCICLLPSKKCCFHCFHGRLSSSVIVGMGFFYIQEEEKNTDHWSSVFFYIFVRGEQFTKVKPIFFLACSAEQMLEKYKNHHDL